MQHVLLAGTAFDLGYQQGERLAGLIPAVVNQVAPPRLDAGEALAAAETTLAQRTPELLEEIHGIAAGAQLPFATALRLNVAYDLLAQADSSHCTAFGFPNTPTGPLVAKTDDVPWDERSFETFFHVRPCNGYAALYYAYAGTVWNEGGVNAAGLAIAMTGLPPLGPARPDGLPSLLLLRQALLHCATVAEVLALAAAHPLRAYGCTLTMADAASGDITVLESTPTRRAVRRHDQTASVCTNHPQSEELLALPGGRVLDAEFDANSRARLDNARRLSAAAPRSVTGLQQLLGDHTQPGGVCQHGAAGLHTAIAMILLPRQRAVLAAEGYGCEPFAEYTL